MTFKEGTRVIHKQTRKSGVAILEKGLRTLVRFDYGEDVLCYTSALEAEQLAFNFVL